jgi:SAM-dependent methyltransferase
VSHPLPVLADLELIQHRRRRWDAVMSRYLPGLPSLEAAIAAAVPRAPAVVADLGGGPGLVAERLAARWPGAAVRLLDIDPVLLSLARAGAPSVDVRPADLAGPSWCADGGPADLVVVIMTMHYFPAARVRALYREIREVLRPGGRLVVADCMDGGRHSAHPDADLAWARWWDEIAADPAFDAAMRDRRALFADRPPAEFTPDERWHRAAARAAGFAETTVIWRRGAHAAVMHALSSRD